MTEPESDKTENETPATRQPNKLIIPAVIAALGIVVAGQAWYLVDLNKQVRDLRASNDADTVMTVETVETPNTSAAQSGNTNLAQAIQHQNTKPGKTQTNATQAQSSSQSQAMNPPLAQNSAPVPSHPPVNDPIFNDPFFQQGFSNQTGYWDPQQDIARMQREMQAMMHDAYQRLNQPANGLNSTDISSLSGFDIEDKGNSYLVKLQLPGADKNNVHVKLQDNVLTVSGEQQNKETRQDAYGNTVFSGQQTSAFSRSVALPSDIKPGSMHSRFNKDTLEISVGKAA